MIGFLLLLGIPHFCFGAANVDFHLYRRGDSAQLNPEVLPANFDRSKITYVLLHGMGGNYQDGCIRNLVNALLQTQDANVIVPNFARAAYLYLMIYQDVAKQISEFLLRNRVNPRATVVMGQSLGAQIGGILKNYGFKPEVMIGMDPAGPQFSLLPNSSKLTAASANFVQSVHTNVGGLGTSELNGHLDVYINRGTDYPCCDNSVCRHVGACYWTGNTIRRGPVLGSSCPSQATARAGSCAGTSILTGFGAPSTSGQRIAHVSINTCIPQS